MFIVFVLVLVVVVGKFFVVFTEIDQNAFGLLARQQHGAHPTHGAVLHARGAPRKRGIVDLTR